MQFKEQLLFRLTELMFQKQQTFLLLDELYEDEVIGSSIRNIQIDSPFQQLLFEGVLSQTNNDNSISISFTHEKLFHFYIGEHLHKNCNLKNGKAIASLALSNKLNGLKEGIANMLIKDIDNGIFTRLNSFIDDQEIVKRKSFICTIPFVHSLKKHGIKITVDKLLKKATQQDLEILESSLDYLEELQEIVLLKKLIDYLTERIFRKNINVSLDLLIPLLENAADNKKKKILPIVIKQIKSTKEYNLRIMYEEKLAGYYLYNGMQTEALKTYLKLYKSNTNDGYLLNNIGSAYAFLGIKKTAETYFIKALATKNIDSYLKSMLFYNLGTTAKDFETALKYYNKAIEITTLKNGSIDLDLAKTLAAKGHLYSKNKMIEEAKNCFDKSLEIQVKLGGENYANLTNSYGLVGTSFFDNDNYELALTYYEKAYKTAISNYGNENKITLKSLNNIALTKLWMKNYESALLDYSTLTNQQEKTNLIDTNENVFWIYFNQSKCALELGYYDEALVTLNKISDLVLRKKLKVNQECSSYILFNKALSNYHLNNSEDSIKGFEQVLKNSDKGMKADAWFYLGYLYYEIDNYLKTAYYFGKYNTPDCEEIDILERLGYSLCCLKDYRKATKIYNQILNIKNLDEFELKKAHGSIALCQHNLKKYESAIISYKKAMPADSDINTLFSIANCYLSLKNKFEAFRYFIEALKNTEEIKDQINQELQGRINITKGLAKELNKENELPEWIKDIK
jgi:tetratricopeptide (TPR) repeat protein